MRIPTILIILAVATATPTDWKQEDQQWRERRMERLRAPDGWLTLVGLHWVEGAPQRFGSAADNDLVLPDGPARAGSFIASFSGVTVRPEPGAVLLDGKPLEEPRLLRADDQEEPDVLQVGRLRLIAIKRGTRWGIRAKDPESQVLKNFKGIESWPIDAKWRIEAAWEAYPGDRKRMISTAQGTQETVAAPGIARFQLEGKPVTLEPILE